MSYIPDPVKIFVVEDDPLYMKLVNYVAELNPDHVVRTFTSGKECLEHLHENPTVVTLDYSLPDMSGEEVLTKIKQYNPDINVIIVSSQENINTAVQLLKVGAYDYITKDDETRERLLNAINNAKKNVNLKRQISELREEIGQKYDFQKSIIGESGAIQKVFKLMAKAIKTNITVSITGETGTGKEVVAKAVHYNSTRKQKPFVAVNIAAIPDTLIESELFGHEKGAFTGAIGQKIGRFELADSGTIFLDEIGELPLELQSKLLRVLQEGEFERLGGTKTLNTNVRVIAATNRNLEEEVANGNFRADLFYRLNVFPINSLPLRERKEDIPLLVKHFVDKYGAQIGKKIRNIPKRAIKSLQAYSWPGNIRELENVIERALILSPANKLELGDWIPKKEDGARADKLVSLEDYERDYIVRVLNETMWRVSGDKGAAKILDMKPTTLESRMKKLGIRRGV